MDRSLVQFPKQFQGSEGWQESHPPAPIEPGHISTDRRKLEEPWGSFLLAPDPSLLKELVQELPEPH